MTKQKCITKIQSNKEISLTKDIRDHVLRPQTSAIKTRHTTIYCWSSWKLFHTFLLAHKISQLFWLSAKACSIYYSVFDITLNE